MSIFSKFLPNDSLKDQMDPVLPEREIIPDSSEFNFNAMLDDVTNAVTVKSEKKGLSLLFEVERDVPSKVIGDRLLLGEVLINLLEYIISLSRSGDVKLKVERLAVKKEELRLKFMIIHADSEQDHAGMIENLNALFNLKHFPGLDPEQKPLMIAREILQKMDAVFHAEYAADKLVVNVEIALQAENLQEKRHYRLPSKEATELRVMIIDEEANAAEALQKKLEYFRHDVVIGPKSFYNANFPDFALFDMLYVSDKVFSSDLGRQILRAKSEHGLKFILVENMFRPAKDDKEALNIADSLIFKPINQQVILDLLINLYGEESEEETRKSQKMSQVFLAKDGLKHAGNDTAFFQRTLQEFFNMYADSNREIITLLNTGKLDAAQKYVAELKAVLANIGAYSLSHHVLLIEQGLQEHNHKHVKKYVTTYKDKFTDTSKAIKNFMIHIEDVK